MIRMIPTADPELNLYWAVLVDEHSWAAWMIIFPTKWRAKVRNKVRVEHQPDLFSTGNYTGSEGSRVVFKGRGVASWGTLGIPFLRED